MCDYVAKRKDNLRQHMKVKHEVVLPLEIKVRTPCQFPDCTASFPHKSKMFAHMSEVHGCLLTKESHQFATYHDFSEWKQNVEADNHVFFSKQTGKK